MMYKALFWKIWRTQRRKYIKNILVILPPILCAYLLVFVKSHLASNSRNNNQTIFASYSKDKVLMIGNYIIGEIVYAPNNSDINRLIGDVQLVLNKCTYTGLENDSAILSYFREHPRSFAVKQFGIVFHELNNQSLSYSIRSTVSSAWHVTETFPSSMQPGPMEDLTYLDYGFLSVQTAINDAFSNQLGVTSSNWTIQEFPYPAYHLDGTFNDMSKTFIPLLFYYAFFFLMCSLLTNVIEEKSSGVKELLKINRIRVWMIYSSWLLIYIILCGLGALFAVIMLKIHTDNGAVFEWANPLILWIFLIFFCTTAILLVFFLSLFFNDAKYALSGLILFWIVCYSLSFSSIFSVKSYFLIFLSTFIPIGSVTQGIRAMVAFEATNEGISFSNLFSTPPSGSTVLPLGVTLFGMMISWVIYGALIWYLDKVKPGKLGIASPWHFIIPDSIKCARTKNDPEAVKLTNSETCVAPIIEKVHRDTPVGIEVHNLTKKFGTLAAVDNLTMDIYQNQITALLGHNGAGKSTLMGIISGIFSPTSGSVYAEKDEICLNLRNFRRDIGLCMQENVLLPSMSVYEHVVFFGMAKGLSMQQAEFVCATLLDRFNLVDKKNDLVDCLSGGMKRKLCLAIALVSDPKILLLDEPTSGLDPESRREIWDILAGYRGNRTILLSTHFMEEADYLGDIIAIMSHGRLKCYGTAMFLKRHYGAGYRLTIANCPENVAAEIKSVVLGSVPSSKLLESGALTFRLPSNDVNKFPKLFHEVEKIIQQSGDSSIALGVTCTNVDDVFLKIQTDEGVKTSVDEVDMPFFNAGSPRHLSFGFLLWQQFFALMVKKFYWTISNWISLLGWLVVFPIVMTYLSLSSSNNLGDKDDPSLLLDLSMYGQTLSYLKGDPTNGLYEYFSKTIQSEGSTVYQVPQNETIVSALLEKAQEDVTFYRTQMIVGGDFSGTPNALFSTIAYHSAPIAVNLMSNAFINRGSNVSRTITTYNQPYNIDSSQCTGNEFEEMALASWLFTFPVGLLSSLAYFILFPHMERITDVKHLQLMTGLSPITYWMSTFLFDVILFSLELAIIIITIVAFDGSGVFASCGFIGALASVVILFGCSGISATYFISFFFNKHNNSMTTYFFISCIIGVTSFIVPIWKKTEWLVYLCYLVPWAPFINSIKSLVFIAVNIYKLEACKMNVPFPTYDLSLIKTELIYLAADTLLYFALIMLFEYRVIAYICDFIMDKLYGPIQIDHSSSGIDQDVQREKTKTQEAMRGEGDSFFISHSLGKKYSRNTTAVYDVNFTVAKKECFGLLGVNGAGKSTTFNMLAGLIRPSKGDAKIGQYSLRNSRSQFLQNLGYCPQLRGLIEDLSARQLLNLFARLRGVQPSQVQNVTHRWIHALDLTEVCDRPCKVYSGGNKRKLSTAMSIIGQPAVMLLDEPTTGVDPVIRRKLWDILRKCQQNDQTIIITSHSMDECEAVCERLTIMVKGLMQCLGPIQFLKNKYGKGHTLVVKVMFNCIPSFYDSIKKKIQDKFECVLKEEQTGILHYHIVKTQPYSQLFDAMNEIKLEHPQIEDFSLGDTSLEQVFLTFARYEQN